MLKSKDPSERQEYSRVQLLLHKPFLDREEYNSFIEAHHNDFVAAYAHWAASDPHAPACVKDDFRDLLIEPDGEHLNEDELPLTATMDMSTRFSSDYSFYRYLGKQQLVDELEQSLPLFNDWAARTKQRYTAEQISDADRWMQKAKGSAPEGEAPSPIDVSTLNPSQRFVYNVVAKHFTDSQHAEGGGPQPPLLSKPLLALLCGTAGSGKTYLIGALKQLLQDRCMVCAPTGVAADNIGGVTYHSKIPVPRDSKNLDKETVRLTDDGGTNKSGRLQKLEADFASVSYLIIDEMSMVGRRSLGQIDELLRQAKGVEQPFGGLSVLLVGDHGQLPPVKDHRAYDWDGVRWRVQAKRGEKIPHAPYWQYHGTKMYELLSQNVFFLDKVERVATSDDPMEAHRLDHFRELQLRARDGTLDEADYRWMVQHMDSMSRPADFSGDDMYRLVTTRKLRDAKNLEALEHQIRSGAHGISIPAVHSSTVAERAVDDDIGLARSLLLCIGARVMVTKNISVAHGLCNGTMGTVYDIICNDTGEAVGVLLRVKKRNISQRGYAGPSFLTALPESELPLGDDEAIIALDRWTETLYEGGKSHTRAQFPVMLASCVTIHKAQGLTLKRVLIDAGPDEKAMGQLFVALTRVRHPDHVAFAPMPSLDRITTLIARKKSLYDRKRHERHLRQQAARTAVQYEECQPAGFTVGAIPPEPPKFVAPDPSEWQTGKRARQETISSWHASSNRVQKAQKVQSPATPNQAEKAKGLAALQRSQRVAARQLEVNRTALTRLGLPPAHMAAGLQAGARPQWLELALPLLRLQARVVDYLPSQVASNVQQYLQSLGFHTTFDDSARQVENTCGVVSARVAVDMQVAHMMSEEPSSWTTCCVQRAVRPCWYQQINPHIGLSRDNTHSFITSSDVLTAASHFWMQDGDGGNVMDWLALPDTFDFVVRKIVTDLHDVAEGTCGSIPLRVRVSNTEDCCSTGMHWFVIAYSIEVANNDAGAWAAVRESLYSTIRPHTEQELQEEQDVANEFFYGPDYTVCPSGATQQTVTTKRTRSRIVCPGCGGTNLDIEEGVDVMCNDCGWYEGNASDNELGGIASDDEGDGGTCDKEAEDDDIGFEYELDCMEDLEGDSFEVDLEVEREVDMDFL